MSSFVDAAPRSVYYPSLVLNLQMRFEEGLTRLPDAKPATPEELSFVGPPLAPPPEPIVTSPGSDNLSQVLGIVPRACSVELPGYRQAGTFSFELEYRDLPLDPRAVRAMAVAIHLDAVPASDFADGMTFQPLPGMETSVGRRKSIVETKPENLLLAGLADDIVAEYGPNGMFIRVEGRDFRGMLLDTPISSKMLEAIDLRQPVDRVVSHIVNGQHPLGAGIQVKVNSEEWPDGKIPSSVFSMTDATRSMLSALADQLGSEAKPVTPAKGEALKMSFWDLITHYCFLVGGVPYFVGSVLWIRPARTLFDARRQEESFDPRIKTPFKDGRPRSLKTGVVTKVEQFTYRRLTFGRGISNMKFERKLGGTKVPVVRCVSTDTSSNQRGIDPATNLPFNLIIAEYPSNTPDNEGARTTNVGAGGKGGESQVITVQVPGVKNKDKLYEIAKGLWQEIGRQEMGGSVQTKNLASFGGDNQDPDLLRLRPGDPVEFRVDASGLGVFPPPISELNQQEARSFDEQVNEVTKRIGNRNLARVLVSINRGEVQQLQKTFRTSNVKFDWNKDGGVAIAFDFQNFLEARYTKVSD